MKRIALVFVSIVIVVGGLGVWSFLVRDDAPAEARRTDRKTATSNGSGSA